MKRYFKATVQPGLSAFHCDSVHHWMSLPGPQDKHDGGFVIVMMDGDFDPDPDWTELPHLLEATPANFNGINTTPGAYIPPLTAQTPAPLPIAGVTHTDTTFQMAKKLGKINRHFHP